MRVVVALGGNALLRRGDRPDAAVQEVNIARAVKAIVAIARRHEVVVTHGNGPQVGLLALESERDPALARPYPLDVIGAETEGMVGYWLARGLHNGLPNREVATLLTQTIVSTDDPGFRDPSKFVGQLYDESTARELAAARGWIVKQDGAGWRRVVPSPEPRGFVEASLIRHLVTDKVVVVCAGGGGIPVALTDAGLVGVEAVVDKDLSSSLLARQVDADVLLMLTDVPAVQRDFGTSHATPIRTATVDHMRQLVLPTGSMGPKVEAACRFVNAGGRFAGIGALDQAERILARAAGTIVTRSPVHPIASRHDAVKVCHERAAAS